MAVSRAQIVDQQFLDQVSSLASRMARSDWDSPVREGAGLSARLALEIFESMLTSRQLDLVSRELKAEGQSFYTIGSSGHEGNAAVAAACRPTDMAFLHYRSGGFFVQRARQVPGSTPILDTLLGITASEDEPISGGRHKVWGSVALSVPPQTSTISSHLPKAVGAAFFLDRAVHRGLSTASPADAVMVCSFGDASSNHSTACGAFNAAAISDYQNLPCPIVFLCEDNGVGISVHTPKDWIAARFKSDPGLAYFQADGLDLVDAFEVAAEAFDHARVTRRPTFLHLKVVRLLGHAGSDVEQLYHSEAEIQAREAQDPLLAGARLLVGEGWLEPSEVIALYEEIRQRVRAAGQEAKTRPRIATAAEVMAPLAPHRPNEVMAEAIRTPAAADRKSMYGGSLPEEDKPRHLAVQLNRVLAEVLLKYEEASLFGEDVSKKGGVYHVTAELREKFGVARVFNTPLDEQTILGLAIGAAQLGQLPIPEIQYLAYLHNAIDQLRGEASSLQFFSNGQFRNPMVCRIAGLAYQKGFGGHFHNDNSLAAVREIPGLLLACPSNARDAVGMMRTCTAAAKVDGAVSVFLEPIALYMTKDLHEERDGEWCFTYPSPDFAVPIGKAKTWTDGSDLTVLTYGNGVRMSLRAARRLEKEGIQARVVDLRWLNPFPVEDMVAAARSTGKVLVVDECRKTGGMAEGILAELVDHCPEVTMARVTSDDSFIPLGDAANLVLLQEPAIEDAMRALVAR